MMISLRESEMNEEIRAVKGTRGVDGERVPLRQPASSPAELMKRCMPRV